jgi:hypothetical protein
MSLFVISPTLRCLPGVFYAVPARPYRGTSFNSLTTMLRSASLAALEMLRICCCGARPSKLCRATLRMHDVHWGSSADRLREAMEGCGVVVRSCQKRCKSSELQIWRSLRTALGTALGRTGAETWSPWHFTLRALLHRANDG